MTEPDPILLRMEAFDRENGGGVRVHRSRGGHTITLTATQPPIARLKPEGPGDGMRLFYGSWQDRWKDVGDMGGLVLPLDEALDHIANTEIFGTRTRIKIVQRRAERACDLLTNCAHVREVEPSRHA